MSNIDWDNAPDWANFVILNHFGTMFFSESFDVNICRAKNVFGDDSQESATFGPEHCWRIHERRPVLTEWHGEGDPPSETICELRNIHAGTEWSKAKIVFASRNVIVWDWDGEPAINGLCTAYRHAVEIRPIRSAKQIEAEEREMSIQAIQEWLTDQYRKGGLAGIAATLHSDGYRKQEAK